MQIQYSPYGTAEHGNRKDIKVAVRLTPKQKRLLDRMAAHQQCTMSEALRRLINNALILNGDSVDV